jgi:hypothetical protein
VLVILREVPPRLEIIPEFVEPVHLHHWSVLVTKNWDWLYFWKLAIKDEAFSKFVVEFFLAEALWWNCVVEWKLWVILLSHHWLEQSLLSFLTHQPVLSIFFVSLSLEFVRVIFERAQSESCNNLLLSACLIEVEEAVEIAIFKCSFLEFPQTRLL